MDLIRTAIESREHTDETVINALKAHGPMGRPRLEELLPFSKSAVWCSIKRLTERGLVRDTGEVEKCKRQGFSANVYAYVDPNSKVQFEVPVCSTSPSMYGLKAKIYAALADGPMTRRQLRNACGGCSAESMGRHLKEMGELGIARRIECAAYKGFNGMTPEKWERVGPSQSELDALAPLLASPFVVALGLVRPPQCEPGRIHRASDEEENDEIEEAA